MLCTARWPHSPPVTHSLLLHLLSLCALIAVHECVGPHDLDFTSSSDSFTTELISTLISNLQSDNESWSAERQSALSNETIKIGYLTNILGRKNTQRQGIVISGAITYAINRINSNTSILGGRRLELVFNDTSGSTINGTAAMLYQWRNGVVAFFGPEDSCEVEATIAAALQLPMISYKCADSKVSRKDFYSTFVRTHPPDTQVVRSVIALLSYYHWNKFSIIWENTPQYKTVVKSLTDQAIAQDFTINSERSFENYYECCILSKPCCRSAFLDIVEQTYKGTRVYLFFGKASDLHRMMLVLRMRGLFEKGEYIVIYVDLEEEYLINQSYKYINNRPDIMDDEKRALEDSARSLLVIVPSPPNGTDYTDFEDKVREFNALPPFNLEDPYDPKKNFRWKRHITIYASYLYDSVVLYCEALAQVMKEGLTQYNGKAIIKKIIERKRYLSVMGAWMNIDENGDVEGNYTLLARMLTPDHIVFKGMNNSQRPSQVMLPVGNFEYEENMNRTVLDVYGFINWTSGDPPLVEPPCGFDGSGCLEVADNRKEVIAGVLMGLLVTVAIVTAVTYRNWKYEQEIAGLLWKINLSDLEFNPGSNPLGASQLSIASQASIDSRFHCQQVFTTTATYRGAWVAVKQLKSNRRTFDISRNVKKEMKAMKSLNHDNINQFIGAYIEPSSIFIITEYCSKGSLYDILENDNFKMDNMFQTSLLFDLISGMIFLHDSDLKFHGNLKSSNCVVTSRWVLKVTDFGLLQLRAEAETDNMGDDNFYRNLLWRSPELLRKNVVGGNPKSDIYAFAVILHEIIFREGPFGVNSMDDMDCNEIIKRVRDYPLNTCEPFRPDLDLVGSQDYEFVLQTMKECWNESPDLRPDFRTIRTRLKKLKQGLKPNIMDNMIAMLEKYADNLEEIVDERTDQLREEKKKVEALLDRMLPRSVADTLMRGETVIPETYDAVTIFFSDIVGFTSMSASSTPMQVVTFLNDLYTMFDSIICNYDVYKVETIGDAYMVVSGLPDRNGDLHAKEIASMALEMLETVKTFKIRHMPEQILQLRIGIHTGPVVAGVVGRTMPRYCLFGDTVNTASRMESNGEALKIHISCQCRDYLVKLGGYVIDERGLVAMKGKGQVLTYWLVSHTTGQMHRRESGNDDTLQVPNFIYSNNISNNDPKKRSPMAGVLPRKGSLIGFKALRTEGSLVNMPAFLRPKVNESLLSIRTNSPKLTKKLLPLRQSKLLLRDQMMDREDINHTNELQIHSKIPKTSSSILIKSSDRLNTLNENIFDPTNQSHVKNESLTPLLSDDNHNGIDLTSIHSNCLIDFGQNCVGSQDNRQPLSGSRPKLNSQVSVKKWNSCSELGDKVSNNRVTGDQSHTSHNNAINSNANEPKMEPTDKDWSKMSIVDGQPIILNESAKDKSFHSQVDSVKLHPGNCDFILKSLNECDLKVESSV